MPLWLQYSVIGVAFFAFLYLIISLWIERSRSAVLRKEVVNLLGNLSEEVMGAYHRASHDDATKETKNSRDHTIASLNRLYYESKSRSHILLNDSVMAAEALAITARRLESLESLYNKATADQQAAQSARDAIDRATRVISLQAERIGDLGNLSGARDHLMEAEVMLAEKVYRSASELADQAREEADKEFQNVAEEQLPLLAAAKRNEDPGEYGKALLGQAEAT